MKIGIITLSCSFNYGAVLQTYGLYDFLKKRGNDVYVINYIPFRYDIDDDKYCENWLMNSAKWNSTIINRFLFRKLIYPSIRESAVPFRKFIKEHIILTDIYHSREELEENECGFDVYITGSDQVWNSDFMWRQEKKKEIIDSPYYLSFAKNKCFKISYAASFGKERLEANEIKISKKYLSEYNYLSVREKSGRDILTNMGLKGDVVADPTILCEKATWEDLASESNVDADYKYVLAYGIDFNEKFIQIAKHISKVLNYRVLYICMSNNHKLRHPSLKSIIVLPDVVDWVKYFQKASFVITDPRI